MLMLHLKRHNRSSILETELECQVKSHRHRVVAFGTHVAVGNHRMCLLQLLNDTSN